MPTEVAKRITLFANRLFEELLSRVELQHATKGNKSGKRRRQQESAAKKDARKAVAQKQAAEGAYRKAISSLETSMAQLSPEQSWHWAQQLHPDSVALADALYTAPVIDGAHVDPPEEISFEERPHPLRGVRFAPLKAPGPSGTRPEHISELLGVAKRRVANRLLTALGKVLDMVAAGEVPEAGRWLAWSRNIWLEKKVGPAPRPIKVGEVLKAAAAKRTLQEEEPSLQPKLIAMHQWGGGAPGGAEAMTHWRSTIVDAARCGTIPAVVTADLDLVNFYNSVEWPEIRASIAKHCEALQPMVQWKHLCASKTFLPDGREHEYTRGAEQGDPFGSTEASLPLGDARERAVQQEQVIGLSGACDEWYIDDGQLICKPHVLDPWLRALDFELSRIGATRGTGEHVKSTARLICPPEMAQAYEGWDTEYVRSTCQIGAVNSPVVALGAMFGSESDIDADASTLCDKVARCRESIASLEHPATELVLTRKCCDTGKFMNLLRYNGDRVDGKVTNRFDCDLRTAVEETLGGPVHDTSWWQATLAAKHSWACGHRATCSCQRSLVAEWQHVPSSLACLVTLRTQAWQRQTYSSTPMTCGRAQPSLLSRLGSQRKFTATSMAPSLTDVMTHVLGGQLLWKDEEILRPPMGTMAQAGLPPGPLGEQARASLRTLVLKMKSIQREE